MQLFVSTSVHLFTNRLIKELKMKRKQIPALLLSLFMIFSLAPATVMAEEPVAKNNALTDLLPISPADIASQIVLGGARSLGDMAVGNFVSVLGFKTPEEQFREQAEQSLKDIQKSITDGFNALSSQIANIDSQLATLQNYVISMQQELFTRIDHSEFDTRMTVINQYTAKVDSIYEEYERLSNETDFEVAKSTAKDIIAKISDADLPAAINYLTSEYISTSAGSRTPMVSLYLNYLKEVYPFLHQYYTPFKNYVQYCELELSRAVLLYTEYCNYMQTANSDDAATVTVWYNNGAAVLNNLDDTVDAIDVQIPDSEYTLTEDNTKYHIVNEDFGISIWFNPSDLASEAQMHSKEREDIGPDDESYYEHGNVPPEMYNKLKELQKKYSPASTTLQFINDNTGLNVTSPIWGCITSEPFDTSIFGPVHDSYQVYSLVPDDPDADGTGVWNTDDDCVRAWTGEFPLYDNSDTNSEPLVHNAIYTEAVAPTCTNGGLTGRVYCSECEEVIMEQNEIPPTGHAIEEVKATAATPTSEGNKAHYRCTTCGKLFSDSSGENEITASSVVIPKQTDSSKNSVPKHSDKAPKTGEESDLALWLLLAVASIALSIGAGIAAVRRRSNQ